MPTYEYLCEKCGKEFEKFQSMNDQPLTVCPKEVCGLKKWGRGRVKKLMSAGAGLLFKGSGFYITDYRSEGYKAAAKKEAGVGSGTGGGESAAAKPAGAEKKPATKAEGKSEAKPGKSSAK